MAAAVSPKFWHQLGLPGCIAEYWCGNKISGCLLDLIRGSGHVPTHHGALYIKGGLRTPPCWGEQPQMRLDAYMHSHFTHRVSLRIAKARMCIVLCSA